MRATIEKRKPWHQHALVQTGKRDGLAALDFFDLHSNLETCCYYAPQSKPPPAQISESFLGYLFAILFQ